MKNKLFLWCALACLIPIGSCSPNQGTNGNKDTAQAGAEILKQAKAVKMLNSFDESACSVYLMEPGGSFSGAEINRFVDNTDKAEGEGAFSLKYKFKGKSKDEYVLLEEIWADYRPDFSFCPLGISLRIKGQAGNKDKLRIQLIQDKTLMSSRQDRSLFYYEDDMALRIDYWHQIVIPYSAFRLFRGKPNEELDLARVTGYRIDIVNTEGRPHDAEIKIDALEQLTSYEPAYGTPKFSSLFIQLATDYLNEDWDADFKACKEVGINTWIIQYSQGFGQQNDVSWYSGTNTPWNKTEYPIVNKMVAAAERQGFNLIFGLFGGDYHGSKTDPSTYSTLYEHNKLVADEIWRLFGASPCFSGWYITEEFHDGAYPDGCWQENPARDMLADYLQNVAAYCKSKTTKYPVQIAPALFRGKPADLCGQWFKAIFERTPDVDVLYLQDLGGRCQVDVKVDLPNYFARIKKACDETGVEFGVDIESFKNCWCPDVPYRAKQWEELKDQLGVAGLFTGHITNFSWATFKPGTGAFDEYKIYYNESR